MAVALYLAFVVAGVCGAVLAARRHGLASGVPSLYIILAMVPSGPEGIPGLREIRVGVALAAIAVVAPLLFRKVRDLNVPAWALIYLGTLLAAALFSSASAESLPAVVRVGVIAAGFALLGFAIPHAAVRQAAVFVAACGVATTLLGAILLDNAWIELRGVPLWGSALASPALGLQSTSTAFIGLVTYQAGLVGLRTHGWRAGLLIALSIPVIILPLKRAIWLAAAVTFVLWVWFEHRHWIQRVIVAAVAGSAAFFGLPAVRQLWEREVGRGAPGVENVVSIRGAIFDTALARFGESPVIGHGLGIGNRDFLIDVGQPGHLWNAHSELGTILSAAGLIGAVALLLLYVRIARSSWSRWVNEGDYLPLLLLGSVVATSPFHRALTSPSILTLGLLLIVVPTMLSRRPQTIEEDVHAAR